MIPSGFNILWHDFQQLCKVKTECLKLAGCHGLDSFFFFFFFWSSELEDFDDEESDDVMEELEESVEVSESVESESESAVEEDDDEDEEDDEEEEDEEEDDDDEELESLARRFFLSLLCDFSLSDANFLKCSICCSCFSSLNRLFNMAVRESRWTYFLLPLHSYVQWPYSRHFWHCTLSADGFGLELNNPPAPTGILILFQHSIPRPRPSTSFSRAAFLEYVYLKVLPVSSSFISYWILGLIYSLCRLHKIAEKDCGSPEECYGVWYLRGVVDRKSVV